MTQGKFITLEGGEGTGKSTQISLLRDALNGLGMDVLVTREPGGAPGAEIIRTLLVEGETGKWDALTEALLHYAARHEHLRQTVIPALEASRWVISDRFADSTRAYQGYGHGLDQNVISQLHEAVVGSFNPDLTIILDIDVERGLKRANDRGAEGEQQEDRYERMEIDFHERVRQGFLDIAKQDSHRCAVVAADQSVDDIQSAIKSTIAERLGVEWS